MKKQNDFFGKDLFKKAFQQYTHEEFIAMIYEEVRPKPYFERYGDFKTNVLRFSYLTNLASMLTSCYAVYWLINWLTGIAVVAYVIAAIFLFFLEKVKRKSSNELFKSLFFKKEFLFGWFCLSAFCFGASLFSSGFGVKEGTEQLSPDAELLKADSMATYYQAEIARLEAKGADLRGNKDSKGTTFYKLSDGITANEVAIADYRKRARELEEQLTGKNEQLTVEYQKEVELTAWTLVWLTLIMELLFECCIAYVWHFYHRSYIELVKVKGISEANNFLLNGKTPLPFQESELQEKIEMLEKRFKDMYDANNQYVGIGQEEMEKSHTEPKNHFRQPIGFFSEEQKSEMLHQSTFRKKDSGQAWTDVDRANSFEDKFTVEHTYTKSGKQKTVHYTLRMVNSRIAQYDRELQDAINKKMDSSIIENRKKWLIYWKGKKSALLAKQQ